MIYIENLEKYYGKVYALKGINLIIEKEGFTGLLGPNGAGKTTLVKTIAGIIKPNKGKIKVLEKNITDNARLSSLYISFLMEGNRNIYWRLTVKENIDFFAGLNGVSKKETQIFSEKYISLFGLKEKEDVQVRNLSRGMQQKVAILCAMARQTPIIILDEPTLGLDVHARKQLIKILNHIKKENRIKTIISSHDMDLIENVCDDVVVIDSGKLLMHEKIEELKKIFGKKIYKFIIKTEDTIKENIKEYAQVYKWNKMEGKTEIVLAIKEEKDLFYIMEIFKKNNVTIYEIGLQPYNMVDMYMEILKKDE